MDQCEATEGIRKRFGLQDPLRYLIGEKLFSFVHASEEVPDFAAELPLLLSPKSGGSSRQRKSAAFLDELERTKFLAPTEHDIELDDIDTRKRNPGWRILCWGAEGRVSRGRQLLQE